MSEQQAIARHREQELLIAEIVETVTAMLASNEIPRNELAKRLGVSPARVSRILNERENLTLRTVADLGWALGLRFAPVPRPISDRDVTPAADDPSVPEWVGNLRHQLLSERH